MFRLVVLLLLAAVVGAAPLAAQVAYRIGPVATEVDEPDGGFSLSLRFLGRASVTFRNLGTIASAHDVGDTLSEVSRTYDDGHVHLDTRTNSAGPSLDDDGRTNNWGYNFTTQVVNDDSDIAFHAYSTVSEGATMTAESGAKMGVDLEFAQRFGGFGRRKFDDTRPFSWGSMLGFSVTDINAKSRGTITATLHTLTDIYSLDGAAPPEAPYTAPSTESITVTNPDGTETTYTIDTTTLLTNRPYQRTETDTPGGARVEGFWQVRGTYFTLRAGPWLRWKPGQRLALRASAGLTYSFLGLEMRYDEWLDPEQFEVAEFVRTSGRAAPEKYSILGGYGALDLEYWLTARTGFFASYAYERVAQETQLSAGGRVADIRISSGSGFRIGLTTLF